MKVHYIKTPIWTWDNKLFGGVSACGVFAYINKKEHKRVTFVKKKVRCKSCKRTKLFRGIK